MNSATVIQYVNNTPSNIEPIFHVFAAAYVSGVLDEDFADLFTINILKGFNPDGTDRMIINAA